MATPEAVKTLAEILDQLTVEGELYKRLSDGKVLCYACGHRCTIFPGKRGICKVRFNEHGTLKVPWGYVAALQCDPTEKKPFNHVLPGSLTLTFGMLGCDYHCPYCMPGETIVLTNRGPATFEALFRTAPKVDDAHGAMIAFPSELSALTRAGTFKRVRAIFKHRYRGELIAIQPFYLPPVRCTPDHRVFATVDPNSPPSLIEAGMLSSAHYLVVPKQHTSSSNQVLDVGHLLGHRGTMHRIHWNLSDADRLLVAVATAAGESSRQIGERLGKSGSYIRHVRRKIARGIHEYRFNAPIANATTFRFAKEHRPGIPRHIRLDEKMARLLGYYCAEGSVGLSKNRPNSYAVAFSFSHKERHLVSEVCGLIRDCFGLEPMIVSRETSLGVHLQKASAALLFQSLAGGRSAQKRVPPQIFNAPISVVKAFLDAYIAGDGHRYADGKVTATSVSRELAHGIAWLVLGLGLMPSIYETMLSGSREIQGRLVNRAPTQCTLVWYERPIQRKLVETTNAYLIPIREIHRTHYDGDVYNMEVEEEHNYVAGLFLVSNCQNYVTSQALRDPIAGSESTPVTPEQMIHLAHQYGAKLIGSSYNEPLITSEWAAAIFTTAKGAGLRTCYISNGNATPEVLTYLKPWTDCYKIDLKAYNDKNYRFLGGTLESVINTITMVHEMGFWTEIVTLVIPGYNDSDDELRAAAEFIASVSPFIPWHVTAFHKDYKMTDPDNTPPETLIRAARIGEQAGLKYVYAGNLPGRVGKYEHTFCHHCGALLVERYGYLILQNRLSPNGGHCPDCGTIIPGIWN